MTNETNMYVRNMSDSQCNVITATDLDSQLNGTKIVSHGHTSIKNKRKCKLAPFCIKCFT